MQSRTMKPQLCLYLLPAACSRALGSLPIKVYGDLLLLLPLIWLICLPALTMFCARKNNENMYASMFSALLCFQLKKNTGRGADLWYHSGMAVDT